MSRNPFADRLTFVYDLPQVVGIGLAAQAVADDLPEFAEWLSGVLQDGRLQPSGRFQALLREHVNMLLTGQTAAVQTQQEDDVSVLALRYWMASAGTAHPPDITEHRELQKRIASEALRTDLSQLPVSRIALIYSAVTRILDASIDQAILSRSHLVTILSRFEAAMRRWRCDDDSVTHPIQWPVTAEREVQDILWLMLRPVFDNLVAEEVLPMLGHSTYRADFGIPSLGILIEVKYVRKSGDFKEIEKQVLEDSVAYLERRHRLQGDRRLHLRRVRLSPGARHHGCRAARHRPHERCHHRVPAQPACKTQCSPSRMQPSLHVEPHVVADNRGCCAVRPGTTGRPFPGMKRGGAAQPPSIAGPVHSSTTRGTGSSRWTPGPVTTGTWQLPWASCAA